MNRPSFFNPTIRFALFLSIIIVLWFLAKVFDLDINAARQWLAQYPVAISGILFIALYVGLTAVLWVGTMDLFRISGALLFGPYLGTFLIWIAEILNAAILFTISRTLGQEFVLARLGIDAQKLDYSKSQGGFWSAFVLRINLLVPFRFMDLGFGLSKIKFSSYIWAVILGSPMRILLVQFIIAGVGEAILKDPTAMYNYLMEHQDVLFWCAMYFLAVIIITVIALIKAFINKRKRKNELK